MRFPSLFLLLTLFAAGSVSAHPDLQEQLDALTRLIAARPDARLYLRRGELHAVSAAWRRSEQDCLRALELDPGLAAARLCRLRALEASGRDVQAAAQLEELILRHPSHPDVLLRRAERDARRGRAEEAALNCRRALDAAPRPKPEAYLLCANLLERFRRVPEALELTDLGLARLGRPVTLQLRAIGLESSLGRYDAALTRLADIEAAAQRRAPWLCMRGEILLEAGRPRLARLAFWEALAELGSPSAPRRGAPAASRLEARIRAGLARTEDPGREKTR